MNKIHKKYISKKKLLKYKERHEWHQETDNFFILRDYKTFYITIIRNKDNKYMVSITGIKINMLPNSIFNTNIFDTLEEAKKNAIIAADRLSE